MDRSSDQERRLARVQNSFSYKWRTRVMYGYAEGLGSEVDSAIEFVPRVVATLRDHPELLEYRREDWPEDAWHSHGVATDRSLSRRHWLTQDQVAQLPQEVGIMIFDDRPVYGEPLDFIAGDPERGNFFEESIRAGALPHFEGVELGLSALRMFTLDRFKNARPDLLMGEVDVPEQAQRWWDYCAHLIGLLQAMQADYEAVYPGAAVPPITDSGGA